MTKQGISALVGAGAVWIGLTSAAMAVVEYDCGSDDRGIAYSATFFDEEEVVEVRGVTLQGEAQSALLRPEYSGNVARFVSDSRNTEFIELGDKALMTVQGYKLECVAYAVTAPVDDSPTHGNEILTGADVPFYGVSLGGKLRSGPGLEYADVGSTFDQMEVQFVQDSGVYMNGYSWWLIQFSDGVRAYQWGGLMCVPGTPVQGLYDC